MFQGPTAETTTGTALRSSVTFTFEPGPARQGQLEQVLEELLAQWQLPPRADRYASSASASLDRPETLELFAQVDRVSQLLTLELWADGRFLFGLDDWVG